MPGTFAKFVSQQPLITSFLARYPANESPNRAAPSGLPRWIAKHYLVAHVSTLEIEEIKQVATAWIEKIWNLSDHSFNILQNDGTWRPYVQERNKSYASDEPIPVSPGDVLTCEHFFIPWIDWGRVRIEGPDGSLEVSIGPKTHSSNDFIRGFDDRRDEVLGTEIGPRGSWWSASVSFYLVFHNDSFNWTIWSATNVGHDILEKAGTYLDLAARKLIEALVTRVLPPPSRLTVERVAGRMNSPSNPR